jgi:predicted DNA-binding transcriptional regulator YafY
MADAQIERYFAESSRQPSFLLRIYPERNALERAMLQFAAYRKETEYDEPSNTYLCRVYYDPTEETELLIRVLSFGPTIKVLEPPGFAAQLKERIVRQLDLNDANAMKEQGICEPSSPCERGHAL